MLSSLRRVEFSFKYSSKAWLIWKDPWTFWNLIEFSQLDCSTAHTATTLIAPIDDCYYKSIVAIANQIHFSANFTWRPFLPVNNKNYIISLLNNAG